MIKIKLLSKKYPNQLVQNGNFADTTGWLGNLGALSIAENRCIFAVNSINLAASLFRDMNCIIGHKYCVTCFVKLSENSERFRFNLCGNLGSSDNIVNADIKTFVGDIITINAILYNQFYIYPNQKNGMSIGATAEFENVMIFDLTDLYGAGNEPSTVEQFRADYPDPYYPYALSGSTKLLKTNGMLNNIDSIEMLNAILPEGLKAVDLGTLDWNYLASSDFMYSTLPWGAIATYGCGVMADFLNYVYTTQKYFYFNQGTQIRIFNSGYTDSVTFKQAMNGVILIYKTAE